MESPRVQASGHAIVFHGVIDEAGVREFEQLLRPQFSELVIDSPGGDAAASLHMAEIVLQHGLAVRVSRLCGSGCAHFVLIAGRTRTLDQGAVIIFHQTPAVVSEIVSSSQDPKVRSFYAGEADLERAFYQRVAVDPRFLLWPYSVLQPTCYRVVRFGADILDIYVHSRRAAWAATPQVLAAFGIKIEGDLPQSDAEFRHRIEQLQPPLPLRSTDAVFSERAPTAAEVANGIKSLHSIAPCPSITRNLP
jgi:hypothetical protein